jgi:hypothetical protein
LKKSIIGIISIAVLAMLFATMILPNATALTHYTIQPGDYNDVYASRCDHLVTPPATNDAWTACGIDAFYKMQINIHSSLYLPKRFR